MSSIDVREIYRIAAAVVAMHGDAYLPIFKRMHEEIQKMGDERDLKTIALKIAKE